MSVDLVNWVLKQVPVIVIMGIVIYVQYKQYREKDKSYQDLSQKVVKIATLYEQKTQETTERDRDEKTALLNSLKTIERGLISKKIINP